MTARGTDDETVLRDALTRLAESAPVPPTDVAADLRRGRHRLRVRHAAVAAGCLTVVALLGGFTALGTSGDGRAEPGYAGTTAPDDLPSTTATDAQDAGPDGLAADAPYVEQLAAISRVLGEHLDPDGGQLELYDTEVGGSFGYGLGEGIQPLWENADGDGGGMVSLSVLDLPTVLAPEFVCMHLGDPAWTCSDADPADLPNGTRAAVVATYADQGVLAVSVHQSDGELVTIEVDPILGNDTLADMGLDAETLLAAAGDERISLNADVQSGTAREQAQAWLDAVVVPPGAVPASARVATFGSRQGWPCGPVVELEAFWSIDGATVSDTANWLIQNPPGDLVSTAVGAVPDGQEIQSVNVGYVPADGAQEGIVYTVERIQSGVAVRAEVAAQTESASCPDLPDGGVYGAPGQG